MKLEGPEINKEKEAASITSSEKIASESQPQSKDMEVHSIANSPDSVYDQLIAEYGLIGLAGFVFLYLAYFLRCLKRNSFAIPILLFTMGILFYGYWFDQLSVLILFEALLLLNRKENNCL